MSITPYWSEAYQEFAPLFYELVGFYELHFNRDPSSIIVFDRTLNGSEILPLCKEEIVLPPYIMYLSQLPLVNRLTEIKQLSHTCILYPGASHTRYEHSIGVMYKANKILSRIKPLINKKHPNDKVTNDDKIILDISALLHDIGHPAWGHALDGITGYVVQLLKEIGDFLFSPKKLDNTIAIYLLTENEQMKKAIEICSQEIVHPKKRELLTMILAQIIMEEEYPYTKYIDDPTLMKKIHLLTTILGRYSKGPGINADRLDWLIRDTHHANVQVKLPHKLQAKFKKFSDMNINDKFKLDVKGEFCVIADKKFQDLMDELREELYSSIYEGLERSFTDSLLIRLAYSTINILHEIGSQIAGAHITTRAIMGYLLMYDYLMKDYTNRILHLSRTHSSFFDTEEPVNIFSSRSDELRLLFENLKCIMHYLHTVDPRHGTIKVLGLDLDLSYIEVAQIEKTLVMVTAESFGKLIEKAARSVKADEIDKLVLLFHSMVAASRIDAIGVLKIPSLETYLQDAFKGWDIHILVNYYFFRKLDDYFRDENITSFSHFMNVISSKKFVNTPFLFIVTDRKEISAIREIFEVLNQRLIEKFQAFFQTLSLPTAFADKGKTVSKESTPK